MLIFCQSNRGKSAVFRPRLSASLSILEILLTTPVCTSPPRWPNAFTFLCCLSAVTFCEQVLLTFQNVCLCSTCHEILHDVNSLFFCCTKRAQCFTATCVNAWLVSSMLSGTPDCRWVSWWMVIIVGLQLVNLYADLVCPLKHTQYVRQHVSVVSLVA